MITITMTDKRTGAKIQFEFDETRLVVELADTDPNNPDQATLKQDVQKRVARLASERLGITQQELKDLIAKRDITLDLDAASSQKYIETTQKSADYIESMDALRKTNQDCNRHIYDLRQLISEKKYKQERMIAEISAGKLPTSEYSVVEELNKEISDLSSMAIQTAGLIQTNEESIKSLTQLMDQNMQEQNTLIRLMFLASLTEYTPEAINPKSVSVELEGEEEGKYDTGLQDLTTADLIYTRQYTKDPEEIDAIDAEIARRPPLVPESPSDSLEEPASIADQKADQPEDIGLDIPLKDPSTDKEDLMVRLKSLNEFIIASSPLRDTSPDISVALKRAELSRRSILRTLQDLDDKSKASVEQMPTTQSLKTQPVPPPKITVYVRDPKTNEVTKYKIKVPKEGITKELIDSLSLDPKAELYKVPEDRMPAFEKASEKGDLSEFKDCLVGRLGAIKKQIDVLGGAIKVSDLDKVKKMIEADKSTFKPLGLGKQAGKSMSRDRS